MGKDLNGKELGQGLSQRKDGRYVYRNGKDKAKYFTKLSDAKKYKRDFDYEKAHGVASTSGETILNDWFDYWIENIKKHEIKPITYKQYKTHYNNHIRNEIGFMKMCDITPVMCQNVLVKALEKNIKPSYTKVLKSDLKTMFADAIRYGKMKENPAKEIRTPKGQTSERKPLTVAEQKEFLEFTKKSRYHNVFVIAFETGMRINEILALQVTDIDFEKNIIHVRRNLLKDYETSKSIFDTPKTKNSIRKIPMTENARKAMQNAIEKMVFISPIKEAEQLIFKSKLKNPVRDTNVRITINLYVNKMNDNRETPFPHIHPHLARHTFATRCVENDMKPKVLQMILGHADITTTMKYYVHLSDEELQKEIVKMNGLTQNDVSNLCQN